ncbi:MAG: hypothetical protein ACHQ1D_10840 [Nitrososphaerales archaeon]
MTQFVPVINDRHAARKRRSDILIQERKTSVKKAKVLSEEEKRRIIFIKGTSSNIFNVNEFKIMKALKSIDPTLQQEQMTRTRDLIKIVTSTDTQKQSLLRIDQLLGIEITVSEYISKGSTSSDNTVYRGYFDHFWHIL